MKTKKIIKRGIYEYGLVQWDGENNSGIAPIDDSVLVLVDVALAKTLGGVDIDPNTVSKQQMMCDTGVVVAMGGGAFVWSSDRTRTFGGDRPLVGDRIIFERYAGRDAPGNDEGYYRIMTDKCVFATFTPLVVAEALIADGAEAEAEDEKRALEQSSHRYGAA